MGPANRMVNVARSGFLPPPGPGDVYGMVERVKLIDDEAFLSRFNSSNRFGDRREKSVGMRMNPTHH